MVTTRTTIVYTVDELSHALSLGKNSTYELVNRPDFPKIRMGRKCLTHPNNYMYYYFLAFIKTSMIICISFSHKYNISRLIKIIYIER